MSNPTAEQMAADIAAACQLVDRMRLAAGSNSRQRAAVDLLAATPVLDQPAGPAAVDSAGGVDWDAIHHAVTTGALDLTQGWRQVVLIACSLASPFNARISLGACLTELTDRQAGAVLAAVRHVLEGDAS